MSSNKIVERLITETSPGEGFNKIEQQPSSISDMLNDLSIKIQDRAEIKKLINPLGENGYFLYHEDNSFHSGQNKVYLINTKRKSVDSIIISKQTWVPVVDKRKPSVFYLVNKNIDQHIEIDLFSNKK